MNIEYDFRSFNANNGLPTDSDFELGYSGTIRYTSPDAGKAPIIDLAKDISSWQVGDTIVIASTDIDPRHSETFVIQQCDECSNFQVRLDRAPTHSHWGRVDSNTGLDQRAEVGLLSRDLRFYGEFSSSTCQYARTRESLDSASPNFGKNWCKYMNDVNGEDRDYHGAHMIFTKGFKNVHVSHLEVFNAGQPRLARYPVHWHQSGYVGAIGGYSDPSSAESLSIHHCFNRFITVHGTHEATVRNNVGYDTHGHGFFFEDGFENWNEMSGNLGILPKPGIILPSDRHTFACEAAFDGCPRTAVVDHSVCEMLSVFWVANQNNRINDNAAVGGQAGFWVFAHTHMKDEFETVGEIYAIQAPWPAEGSDRYEWENNTE